MAAWGWARTGRPSGTQLADRSAPAFPHPPPLPGYAAYQAGDWGAARAVFEETLAARADRQGRPLRDGPSATLLK